MPEEFNNQNAEMQAAVNNALKEEKKKKRKKRLIIIAVAAVIIIGIIAASSNGGDNKTIESSGSTTASSGEESQSTTQDQIQKAHSGDIVTLDRIKVTFKSCNADFKKYSQYSAPEKGNKVIRAEFEFENISDSDVSLSGFDCYADNKKCEEFYGTDDYASPTLESVSPGRTFKSVIYFQVPKDSKNIELELEDELWGSSKTIFIIE